MRAMQGLLIGGLWISWGLYWCLAARGAKAIARHESMPSRLAHLGPLALAVLLLAVPFMPGWLGRRFLRAGSDVLVLGDGLLVAGLLLTVWARVLLGGNWSATVTLKHDHQIVRDGPYRWVRHPIYAGLLLAFIGSALARGEWRGLVAVLIVFVALWRKLRMEEAWLEALFGARYGDYRASTWALIPFVL